MLMMAAVTRAHPRSRAAVERFRGWLADAAIKGRWRKGATAVATTDDDDDVEASAVAKDMLPEIVADLVSEASESAGAIRVDAHDQNGMLGDAPVDTHSSKPLVGGVADDISDEGSAPALGNGGRALPGGSMQRAQKGRGSVDLD